MKNNLMLFFASCAILWACTSETKKNQNNEVKAKVEDRVLTKLTLTPAQLVNANIALGNVQKTKMNKLIQVTGVMDVPPSNIVSVSIPMGGYLTKTNLIPGMLVKKGAVIAVLEDQAYIQLQQDYLTAKSKLAYLEADYERQKALNTTKAVSDKVFQLAKTDYESQKYLVKSLDEKLRLISLNPNTLTEQSITRTVRFFAPISGYVTKVNVNIGKYVAPTDVLFEIMDPSDLHLRLTVFENDATFLKIGDKVSFHTNNNTNVKYGAKIAFVTPNVNEERSTDVHCHLTNSNTGIYPGTFVNAEIELGNAQVNALPEEAVVKWENKPYVFVKEADGIFSMIPVEVGLNTKGWIEIKTNLNQSNIVIKNAYTLLMKLKNNAEE
jgi:cobalt-zinc-cadmium efflux system membrane fusion protein